jgi:hypothetical protein
MIQVYVYAALALLLVGAVVGILIVIAVGIHHSERTGSLTTVHQGRVASGVRILSGVRVPNDRDICRLGVTAPPTGQRRSDLAA